jgi:hypothetical protein
MGEAVPRDRRQPKGSSSFAALVVAIERDRDRRHHAGGAYALTEEAAVVLSG